MMKKNKKQSGCIFFSKSSGLIKTLQAMTAAAVLTAAVALPVCAESFPDCESVQNQSLITAADRLSDSNIFTGYPDGSFKPFESMSRAEMAAILGRVISGTAAVTDDTGFPDVDSTCFASGYIKTLHEKNLINGTDGGLFDPDGFVTYNEFVKSVVMLIENYYGAGISHDYPDGYINAAEKYSAFDGAADFVGSAIIPRGEAAIILSNTLDVPLVESVNPATGEVIQRDGKDGRAYETPASVFGIAPAPTSAPTVTQAPTSGVNDFAMKMNNQMDSSENYMFSPLSIKMALAMTANGSADKTKSEMLAALGIDNLDEYNKTAKALIESYNSFDFDYQTYNELTDKVNSGEASEEEHQKWYKMNSELISNEKAYLSIANSIWVNKEYKNEYGYKPSFKPDFENIIKDSYGGTSGVVDNSDAVERINKWTSDKTNGKITEIIADSDFLAALVNAVYFNGKWESEFPEYATNPDTFNNADGTTAQTDFMNALRYVGYYADDSVQMIKLPYKGGNTAMYISIDDGNISGYDTYFDLLEWTDVNISMPKFRIEYSKELNDLLERLGIERAFSADTAQFPNICDGIPDGENIYIDKVLHKTYIDVDEEGTEAAAVTAVIMGTNSLSITPPEPIEFKADKPFTFIIRDESSGEIIFMGRLAQM